MRVALAQINTTVGDIWGNVERMADALERAVDSGADLVAYPELTIPGYPPEDLLMRPSFIEENVRALGWRDTAPLPQALPPQLQRLRREPLLQGGFRGAARGSRQQPRWSERVRGHLVPWRASARTGTLRGQRAPEHLGLALPQAQGRLQRAYARRSSFGLRLLCRVLQSRGRPGRARL